MEAYKILVRPVVTEKMTQLSTGNHFAFEVAKGANKIQIARAVEDYYPGVQVKEVRTMVVRGKRRGQFTRRGVLEGRRTTWKKAIVTLASGTINFYEEV